MAMFYTIVFSYFQWLLCDIKALRCWTSAVTFNLKGVKYSGGLMSVSRKFMYASRNISRDITALSKRYMYNINTIGGNQLFILHTNRSALY